MSESRALKLGIHESLGGSAREEGKKWGRDTAGRKMRSGKCGGGEKALVGQWIQQQLDFPNCSQTVKHECTDS